MSYLSQVAQFRGVELNSELADLNGSRVVHFGVALRLSGRAGGPFGVLQRISNQFVSKYFQGFSVLEIFAHAQKVGMFSSPLKLVSIRVVNNVFRFKVS